MSREKIEITVERKHYGLLLSTIYKGEFYKHKYDGNVKESKQHFRQYVKEEDSKIIRSI